MSEQKSHCQKNNTAGVEFIFKSAALIIFCLWISACTGTYMERKVNMDIGSGTIYKYEWVERNPPEVHVYPAEAPSEAPTALLVPFKMMQAMPPHEGEYIAQEVTRTFWQTWIKEEMLPVIEYDTSKDLYSLNRALAAAKIKGADLLITGQINYFISGGSAGFSTIMALPFSAPPTTSIAFDVVSVNSSILARVPGPALLLAMDATISP